VTLKEKAKILDELAMDKAIERMAHEVIEKTAPGTQTVIVGIKSRGAYIGNRLADKIKNISGTRPKVGALDITLYRDDLTQVSEQPTVHATEIDFDIDRKRVVLVDDVLFTGRTIR
jgi:pyrimidine operon attenuation protein/uracil phosphoribosyltransferase